MILTSNSVDCINKNVLLGSNINGNIFFHAMPMLKRKFKVEDYFHLIEKAPKSKAALLC